MLQTEVSLGARPNIINSHQNLVNKEPAIIGRDIQWNINDKKYQNNQNNQN